MRTSILLTAFALVACADTNDAAELATTPQALNGAGVTTTVHIAGAPVPSVELRGTIWVGGTQSTEVWVTATDHVDEVFFDMVTPSQPAMVIWDPQLQQRRARGHDRIDGQGGDDRPYADAGADTIYGGGNSDYINGNDGGDYIYGEGGKDRIFGGSGRDHLYGGSKKDVLRGGDGRDYAHGGSGDDDCTAEKKKEFFCTPTQSPPNRCTAGHPASDCIRLNPMGDKFYL